MTAVQRYSEQQRIEDLRKKIHDADYIHYAVLRIANILSNELIDRKEVDKNERK